MLALLAGAGAGALTSAGTIAAISGAQRQQSDRGKIASPPLILDGKDFDANVLQTYLGVFLPELHSKDGDRDDQAVRRAAEAAHAAGGGTVSLTRPVYEFGASVALNGLENVTFESRTGSVITSLGEVKQLRAFVGRADARGPDGEDLSEQGASNIVIRGITFDGGLANGHDLDSAPFHDYDSDGRRQQAGEGAFARWDRAYEPGRASASQPRRGVERAVYVLGDMEPGTARAMRFSDVVIEGVRLIGLSSLPIYLRGVRGLAAVDDSYAYRCLDIGFTYCENVRFNRNRVVYSADNGVSISRGNRNVTCSGNLISKAFYFGIHLGGFNGQAGPKNVSCTGNTIVQTGSVGINLYDAPSDITITGNYISDVHRGFNDEQEDLEGYAIVIRGTESGNSARNIVVVGNNITRAHRGGVCIAHDAEDILISGNTFQRIGLPTTAGGSKVPLGNGEWNVAITKPGPKTSRSSSVRRIVAIGNAVFEDREVMLPASGPLLRKLWAGGADVTDTGNYASFDAPAQAATDTSARDLSPLSPHDGEAAHTLPAGTLRYDPRGKRVLLSDGEIWRDLTGAPV